MITNLKANFNVGYSRNTSEKISQRPSKYFGKTVFYYVQHLNHRRDKLSSLASGFPVQSLVMELNLFLMHLNVRYMVK